MSRTLVRIKNNPDNKWAWYEIAKDIEATDISS